MKAETQDNMKSPEMQKKVSTITIQYHDEHLGRPREEVLQDAITGKGKIWHLNKAAEEAGELIQQLSKFARNPTDFRNRMHLLEELAQVKVEIEKLYIMFKDDKAILEQHEESWLARISRDTMIVVDCNCNSKGTPVSHVSTSHTKFYPTATKKERRPTNVKRKTITKKATGKAAPKRKVKNTRR